MPLISVVVPVYNVEPYLEDCLDSLRGQTVTDLEVILVDDGSEDSSRDIARRFVAEDERFRLVELEHAGQGRARNVGAGLATGRYLAFADSDDVVPADAYERLVASLDRTGSDFATGNVYRLNIRGPRPTGMYGDAFARDRQSTHVGELSALVRDTSICNKVFRRSFWVEKSLEFVEGVAHEDVLVAAHAHVAARAVDVLSAVVYHWRERSDGPSLAETLTDIENLLERLDVIEEVNDLLTSHGHHDARREHDLKVLGLDLRWHLTAVPVADEIFGWTFVEAARGYLESVDPSVFRKLHAISRLQYHLLSAGRLRELLEVLRFERQAAALNRVVVEDGRAYGDYPYRGDAAVGVPDDIYELDHELTLVTEIDDVQWLTGSLLEISGTARIDGLAHDESTSMRVVLRDGGIGREIRLPATVVSRPDVTATTMQTEVDYEWCGLRAVIDVDRILAEHRAGGTTDWDVAVEVTTQGIRREAPFANPYAGRAARPAARDAGDVRINPYVGEGGELRLMAHHPAVVASGVAVSGSTVTVTGRPALDRHLSRALAVRRTDGMAVELPLTQQADFSFSTALDLAGVRPSTDGPAASPEDATEDWQVFVETLSGRQWPVQVRPLPFPVIHDDEGTGVAARATPSGLLAISVDTPHLPVDSLSVEGTGLRVSGSFHGAVHAEVVISLESKDGVGSSAVATVEGSRFTASLSLLQSEGAGAGLPVQGGQYHVTARLGTLPGSFPVRLSGGALESSGLTHGFPTMVVTAAPDPLDRLVVAVQPPLRENERGPANEVRMQRKLYVERRRHGLRDAILFESWGGKYAACNPRGIQAELGLGSHGLSQHWVVRDHSVPVPPGVQPVLKWSQEYYDLMARSRYVVSNDLMADFFDKRPGQVYVQTWHGTPLKRLFWDAPKIRSAARSWHQWFKRETSQWDYLISPNSYSTDIFRRAFRYDGEILETGYPRNDVFHGPDVEERAARVRAQLGIPQDRTVVLYAPTWRDNAVQDPTAYEVKADIDLDALYERFGEDVLILFRGHQLVVDAQRTAKDDRVFRDLSRYPDIQDLYLVSDAAITDYSSVMFDFANTGRPLLFFTYDLEFYRDFLRGFYFDFENEAPGPLLRTSDEVLDALADLPGVQRDYAERYRSFQERFTSLEDGKAGARVLERIMR